MKRHPFFSNVDWEALYARQIKPPFKPKITGAADVRHFDPYFTHEKAVDSYVDSALSIRAKAANKYDGFTYKDPHHL
jgi:hypothetical protein